MYLNNVHQVFDDYCNCVCTNKIFVLDLFLLERGRNITFFKSYYISFQTTLLPKTMRTKSPRKVWKTKSTTQSTTLSTTDWTNNTTLSTTTSSSLEPFNLTPRMY